MSFSYDVMTDEQAQKAREFPLLPEGIYDFAVIDAKFKWSGGGNPMIELKLQIVHEGQQFNVFDNLIGTKNMTWKTIHFCRTTGLEKEYLAGQFKEHLCARRRGVAAIGYVPARPKNDGTTNPDGSPAMWKAKNEIVDYIAPDKLDAAKARVAEVEKANPFAPPASKLPPQPVEAEPFLNDDIPF